MSTYKNYFCPRPFKMYALVWGKTLERFSFLEDSQLKAASIIKYLQFF